ncbi:hypothetical protein OAF63_00135 [Saprospiraceae bacterium]|jgi:hypothetical protein|nr:hypothetical protein [Bacteroidota bacterium]MDB4727168.1 hypothetical protein [Saprospiraceae bacterium]MDF1863404.1 hypothetical protein [Saprospiraceae bacterium]
MEFENKTLSGAFKVHFHKPPSMSFQDNIITTGKEKTQQMKAFLEEMQVQMALGKAEAKDAFEREQKNFKKFINHQMTEMKKLEKVSEEHVSELSQKFNNLEALITQEIPHSKRKFDTMKKNTLQAIYELEFQIKTTFGDVDVDLQKRLDEFKVKLDGYRIQLALSNFDDEAVLVNRKEELQKAIDDIQAKMNEEEESKGKVENFVEEITESFDHMKKAFSELFS